MEDPMRKHNSTETKQASLKVNVVYMNVSVCELIRKCLVLGSAEAWKCSRVPPLTRRHFDLQALILFEPDQVLTWNHMFGRAQELSCAILSGRERERWKHFTSLSSSRNRISHQVILREEMRDLRRKKQNKHLLSQHNISKGEDRRVNYIKQTYVILILLKLWITSLINHSLIWVVNLYVAHYREISSFLSSKGRDYFFLPPELFFIAEDCNSIIFVSDDYLRV